MGLCGGGAMRQSPSQRTRGPAILANADGAFPPAVQVVSHNYNNSAPRKRGLAEWMWTLTGHNRQPGVKRADTVGELQIMLPMQMSENSGDVCLLAESPYRILRVAIVAPWDPNVHRFAEVCTPPITTLALLRRFWTNVKYLLPGTSTDIATFKHVMA
ncbi:unnamed protein product [Chilo suppressalis]|uniref:Uncharacterized protein n=1 Tax=Chilo suppressalis TaxID=168631 RepID=A0ABN8B377_CHISP|nr:unnamed protein product [Chilo suppressalis]